MAYRKIHDSFWTDPDIEELTPEQKYFYIYLITNPNVNQLGLYEFSIKRACFETGYNRDTIEKLLEFFENCGKIRRSRKTREILIIKFYYHNKSNSQKLITHINTLLSGVKDTSLIQYIYSMHTLSQEEEEEEEEEKEESKDKEENKVVNIPFEKFWDTYGKKVGSKAKTEKAWNKLKDSEREFIIKNLPAYVTKFTDKQYQPYPTTFLNERRWEAAHEMKHTQLDVIGGGTF